MVSNTFLLKYSVAYTAVINSALLLEVRPSVMLYTDRLVFAIKVLKCAFTSYAKNCV